MTRYYRNRSTGTKVAAVQFTGNFIEIELFVGGDAEWRGNRFTIAGPNGALHGGSSDWIVRDSDTTAFYTLTNDEFNNTFEELMTR